MEAKDVEIDVTIVVLLTLSRAGVEIMAANGKWRIKRARAFSARFFGIYFSSWWLPSATLLCVLLVIKAAAAVNRIIPFFAMPDFVTVGLLFLIPLTAIGILLASAWNFTRKRYVKGMINFLASLAVLIVAVPFISLCLLACRFLGPSEDKFADDLVIPKDIEISEPLDSPRRGRGGPADTFQTRLISALSNPVSTSSLKTAGLSSLVALHETAPKVLRRYLASSPSWRVFKERNAVFATRRWMIGPKWRYSLHGYYSQHDLGLFRSSDGARDFSCRVTLAFSGRPWAQISDKSTCIRHDEALPIAVSTGDPWQESHLIVDCGGLLAEFFERPGTEQCPLTRASLLYIEGEFRPLASLPEFSTIRTMLPAGSIRNGKPTIELLNGYQPGIYESQIWVNPGEPGMTYLKVYEVTKNTRLSKHELDRYSNEWVGWSDDPSEMFFSNTVFTIFEGDWGKPYAARFEVWFVPDSGQTERKLTERLFKIEGWQR